MQVPKYSPPQDSFSTKLNSRVLAIVLLLTPWRRLHCSKCRQPCTPCCCQPQTRNLAVYHSLAPFSWYLIPAKIREKRRESSISWAIRACKLVCLPGVTLKKDQETWLPACGFAWSWGICCLARLSCPVRSFGAWLPYRGLASEVPGRDKGSIDKRPLDFGAWKIVLPRFSIVSGDQGLLCKKPKDDTRSWAQKACSRC